MSGTPSANLAELAAASATRFASRPLFGEHRGGGWEWTTYASWYAGVDALRGGLATLDLQPGERVAIISRNSTSWATAAYASYGLGLVFVPMYETQRAEDWEFILRDCAASVVFVRTRAIADAVEQMHDRLPALRHIVLIETAQPPGTILTLAELQAHGREHPVPMAPVAGSSLAGLVYTSGTTGLPKGAILTHDNLTSNVTATLAAFPLDPSDRTVSFLPWAHVYGQVCELHLLVAAGASTAFNTNVEHLIEDLGEVKPTILVAVPRIFNKLHSSVVSQIESKPKVIRRLFWRGLRASIARRRGDDIGFWDRIVCAVAGILFAAIRRKLGGHLRYAVSASATLSREVAEFVDGLGIEVYEGYGLTETSAVVTVNRPGKRKFGSVGLPIADVRLDIDTERGTAPGEGEIVIHGPNVMKGYHARPKEDAQAFTPDGGLRTGDIGRLDADGYLYITGRIKEQYKLENGKYVMPSPLEEKLALSLYVRNVMLYGDGRPYNVALVVIDGDHIRAWAEDHHISLGSDLTRDERVRALIAGELARNGASFRGYERPVDFALIETPFSLDNGLLTPTLKLKRREVAARYRDILEALYQVAPADRPPAPPRSPGVSLTR